MPLPLQPGSRIHPEIGASDDVRPHCFAHRNLSAASLAIRFTHQWCVDRPKHRAEKLWRYRRRVVIVDEHAQPRGLARFADLESHAVGADYEEIRAASRLHTLRRGGCRSVITSSTESTRPSMLPRILITEPAVRPLASRNRTTSAREHSYRRLLHVRAEARLGHPDRSKSTSAEVAISVMACAA